MGLQRRIREFSSALELNADRMQTPRLSMLGLINAADKGTATLQHHGSNSPFEATEIL
jgi:hypothetical protein